MTELSTKPFKPVTGISDFSILNSTVESILHDLINFVQTVDFPYDSLLSS